MLTIGWIYFLTFCGLGALIGLLFLYYDRQDDAFYQRGRNRHLFYCIKCGNLFSGGRDEKQSDCPECGHTNLRLHF